MPHLSNRRFVYLFPYRAVEADYVLLDVTSNPYPLSDAAAYVQNIWQTLNSGLFKVVVAQDGYLLLQRGTVQEPGVVITSLPDSFFTYTHATPDMITNRTTGVAFKADAATIHLLGYSVTPTQQVYLNNPVLTVTTYWRITGTLTQAVHPEIVVTYPSGATFSSADSATTQWLPMDTWPKRRDDGRTELADVSQRGGIRQCAHRRAYRPHRAGRRQRGPVPARPRALCAARYAATPDV